MSNKIIHDFKAMGCPCRLVFYPVNHIRYRDIIELVDKEIRRLENKYSRYLETSVTSNINRIAAHPELKKRRIHVDNETANLLQYADVAFQQSDFLFDITSGAFRRIWNKNTTSIPSAVEIKQLQQKIGWNNVRWDFPILRFLVPGMEIDFGGIVKEYAVDTVCRLLTKNTIKNAYIDLGGDIGIVGPQIDGSAWTIGIQNPHKHNHAIATIELYHGAIASSGDYERYIPINGKNYGHIINPKTAKPVDYWSSVSVAATQCLVAGTAATVTMLKEASGKSWLKELGLNAIAVTHRGKIYQHHAVSQPNPCGEFQRMPDAPQDQAADTAPFSATPL